tara:strand:- start:29429 stop:30295 length:867 start_codon:yes stop_codon:yes gene_type:complete
MRALVIGGSGFLGSHISDQLTLKGHEVIIFDKQKSNWMNNKQKFIQGDISDYNSLEKAFKDVDVVFHLAGISDLDEAYESGISTATVNILGTVNSLELSCRNNISRFVYASSVYVSSNSGGLYKVSKKAAEDYVLEYNKLFDLDFTIIRYGSIYGPRSDDSNGLYRIIRKAVNENKLEYEGSLDSIREYVHVEDVAIASSKIVESEFQNKVINLTGQERLKIEDLLKMIAEILDLDPNVKNTSNDRKGHYITTPYNYNKPIARKYVMPFYIDFGQGILQMIEEIKAEK